MIAQIYELIGKTGYQHPLHPALTHLVIGTTVAAFFFAAYARLTGRTSFLDSARHCSAMALIFLPLVVLAGYLDWQHYYGGKWMGAIKVKLLAAALLLIFLPSALATYRRHRGWGTVLLIQTIALLCVMVLGYAGGELVY